MDLEKVVLIEWLESEFGWGIRPDGYSLHLNQDNAENFIEDYWNTMPEEVPNEYSRPCYPAMSVKVTPTLYLKISESENGIRFYNRTFDEYIKSGDIIK